MCVRPGARGCAGGRARIRERKLPESPAYMGFLLYYTLKSQCDITVSHCLCGKSASKRAVIRVVGLKIHACQRSAIHATMTKFAMYHPLTIWLCDAPHAVFTFTYF